MMTERQIFVEGHHQGGIGKGLANGEESFKAQTDDVVKMNDIGPCVLHVADEVALDVRGVRVRQHEVVVLVGVIKDFILSNAERHECRRGMPRHRVADAGEVA